MATVASTDIRQPLRVIEFYAGVGGFHFSLLKSKVKAIVIASVDINTNTNAVYKHNFPHTLHLNRNICGMTAKELDNLRPDVFVLSPPCQPFTRQGQRRDNLDRRTDSFFHLMELLAEMECPPSYLLMENVQGFEISHTRNHFTTMLHSLNFSLQEFLLSPVQFSVPNSRLRYYLLAKRAPLKFGLQGSKEGTCKPCTDPSQLLQFIKGKSTAQKCKETGLLLEKKIEDVVTCTTPTIIKPSLGSEQKLTNSTDPIDTGGTIENTRERDQTSTQSVPTDREVFQSDRVQPTIHTPTYTPEDTRHIDSSSKQTIDPSPFADSPSKPDRLLGPSVNLDPLSMYLEPLSDSQLPALLVPDKILLKYAIAMDIVRPVSRRSCCFTKAYGQYTVGTGSIMQQFLGEEELALAFEGYKKALKDGVSGSSVDERQDPLSFLRPLKLRYFTPREVANLMSFPPSFSFPPSLSRTQCYKVMGNSLNVSVVASLMQYLFCDVQYL